MLTNEQKDKRFLSRLYGAEAAQKFLQDHPDATAADIVAGMTMNLQLMWMEDAEYQKRVLLQNPGGEELVEKLLNWEAPNA